MLRFLHHPYAERQRPDGWSPPIAFFWYTTGRWNFVSWERYCRRMQDRDEALRKMRIVRAKDFLASGGKIPDK